MKTFSVIITTVLFLSCASSNSNNEFDYIDFDCTYKTDFTINELSAREIAKKLLIKHEMLSSVSDSGVVNKNEEYYEIIYHKKKNDKPSIVLIIVKNNGCAGFKPMK